LPYVLASDSSVEDYPAQTCSDFAEAQEIYHRQMKIRFLKISQVIDNQVIVKSIETENSIADGIQWIFSG
jgi:hypothetical protein